MLGTAKCGKLLGQGPGRSQLSAGDGATTFGTQDYTGTAKLLGGTAAYKGIVGSAKLSCTTPDSVHFSCAEKLKLRLRTG